MSYDVAIVGAGIVGAATAAALAREGLLVVVLDRQCAAGGTTAAGMGHIVVMDDSPEQLALTLYSQQLWGQLAEEMPAECEFDRCGTIWVAADEDEMAEVRRKHELYSTHGIETEILDNSSLLELEPNLSPRLAGGLLVPGDSVVYQLTATRFLLSKAGARGAIIRSGAEVAAIVDGGVKLENGEKVSSRIVINATGADAMSLSPELDIRKRKGHLVITDRYPGFARHQLVELGYLRSAHGSGAESVAFNVQPRKTGQLILGSSRQFDAADREIDRAILGKMTARAFEYMPGLKKLSAIRIWTGSRPATPDNLPYIGRLSVCENVFAAAGHEGLGITTSLGTAELIADAIVGRESAIPSEPYRPDRTHK